MYEIRIELKSDLCASSGEGYATTIDTDIVTDRFGIPFIPARRLKGCLREAAVYIYGGCNEVIDKIFGVAGEIKSGSLRLENAKIEEHEAFSKMCVENRLSPSRVTELFCDTYASTAVEASGAAKENTLRFLRYVSKKKAWATEENLVFCADVQIEDEYINELGRICKALRHIGYKRNRGLGNVKCSLALKNEAAGSINIPSDIDADKDYIISYAVRLDEQMMLPSQAADETADYIGGQAVVGALAGKHLKVHKADEAFDEIFLSGSVRFSNLYITDTKLRTYVPIPQIFGKTKQSEQIIDLTVTERNSQMVKPLKAGYINGDSTLKMPLTERVYHNNTGNSDGGLYVQNCLSDGQLFMGTISGKGLHIKVLAELLCSEKISFGRSKSAQYSACRVVSLNVKEATAKKVKLKKGDKVVYLFESDAILTNAHAGSAIAIADVCNALGIDESNLEPESCLKYKMISGYLSVMRLQRAHTRAIAAGSALVMVCDEDTTIDEFTYVGGRQNDGFGRVRAFKAGELLKDEERCSFVDKRASQASHDNIGAMLDVIEKDEKMRGTAISYALEKKASFLNDWGASFIGRVILMLKQSDSELDFGKRVASIKTLNKRKTAERFIADAAKSWESDPQYKTWLKKQEYMLMILTLAKYFHREHKGGAAK